MRAVRYVVECDAAECEPDRWTRKSRPLTIDAANTRQAGQIARRAGWRPSPIRSGWWCPFHAMQAKAK